MLMRMFSPPSLSRGVLDRAEVDAGQLPAAVPANSDVGRAERAVDGPSPVVPGLGVRADGDRRVAVYPDRLDGPLQGGGVQVAGAVALRPLLLVQDEAERADQLEVGNRQGVEGGGVARLLGAGPGVVQLADVDGVGVHAPSIRPLTL